jgi:hypothetical protein
MPSTTTSSRRRFWTGRIITALPVLFLLFDAGIKLAPPNAAVTEAMTRLGWPTGLAFEIGILELICLVAYLVPRTAVLGAVLFTGFLGGAIATHMRISNPLFSHTLFPTYVGALLWVGLYLRDERVRALVRAARIAPPARPSVSL